MNAYQQRNEILLKLGYVDYQQYLNSSLWKSISRRVLEVAEHKCRRCDSDARQVHHLEYTEAALKGQDDSKLFPTCRSCHKYAERTKGGRKRSLKQANAILNSKVDWSVQPKLHSKRDRSEEKCGSCGKRKKSHWRMCKKCLRKFPSDKSEFVCKCGKPKQPLMKVCKPCSMEERKRNKLAASVAAIEEVFGIDEDDEFSMPWF